MKKIRKRLPAILITLLLALTVITGCSGNTSAGGGKNKDQTSAQTHTETSAASQAKGGNTEAGTEESGILEDEEYTSKEDVAAYIHLYQHLPDNYITKAAAKALGWVSSKGNLWDVAPGKSIGGDYFGNYEKLLPEKKSRKYYECDVNYEGGYRGDDRLIYSNDGLIYFTGDHYNTFERLYGEEN